MEVWKEYKISEVIDEISMGPFGSNIKVDNFINSGVPVLNGSNLQGFKLNENSFNYVSQEKADSLGKANAYKGDVVITHRGTLGQIVYIPDDSKFEQYVISQSQFRLKLKKDIIRPDFFVYFFHTRLGQHRILMNASQVGVPALARPTSTFKDVCIPVPPMEKQNKVMDILHSLDDKIEVNRRINDNFYFVFLEVMLIWLLTSLENDNLEQQALAIFDMMFPAVASGEDVIGNVITPKRGKGLLSKDAVEGNVPVVAGGLEPATYHNESNTVAPVVTISASGANAGFVNLWQIPVWSSDSSFIDASMTENVYFWYVMLKKRQKEIFDAQTGSAQPHIYPKHIAEMSMGNFEQSDVEKFTELVTPMFEIRGRNLKESERLASLRDTLLPKLMSGELKLNEVNM